MKKIPGVISVLIFCLLITACQSQEAKRQVFTQPQYDWGKISGETLTVWGSAPDLERTYIQKAFQRYEELTHNQLEVVQYSKDEIVEKMTTALNQGEAPDIFVSYGGTNIDVYNPDENFYDFSQAKWINDLTDTSINQTVYHGKIIGLPHWEASVSGTLYNKDIFEKYNIEVPKTQEEFMSVCEELLSHGITPMYMPAKEISMLLYQFPLDSIVEDSDVLNQLNQFEIGYEDIPEMLKIVEWYKEMATKGYFGDHYLEDDWNGMSPALESQKYAMLLCWDTWLYTDFKGDASQFGLMPAFLGVPYNGTFEGPNLNLFMVNKKSKKLDVALDFITFLADPYNYNVAFENIPTASVFKNQVGSITTYQYLENERLIEKNYRDSIAWLRIKEFSQMDAICIYEYIHPDSQMSAKECLEKMTALRKSRINQ